MAPRSLEVELQTLHFDPDNPRLVGEFDGNEKKIFRYLITDIGVDDLLQSMGTIGFIDGDPFIVRERPEGGYFVVEGNRRLAALKLLTGETPEDGDQIPSVPAISTEAANRLKLVRVQIGWSDDLLQAYLGYKHVTAAREWPPEAKAKFVFKHAKGDFSKENLTKFAKVLGTKYANLKRWLIAYLALLQAEKEGKFDFAEVPSKRYFGTFYTLLGGANAKEFLLLNDDPISIAPVADERIEQLGEFVIWTIGSKTKPSVVNSRDQAKFEQVLGSPKALDYFKVKEDLEGALFYTEYTAGQVARKLREATYTVDECIPSLYNVREDQTVREAFTSFEQTYKKARLNIRGDDPIAPTAE